LIHGEIYDRGEGASDSEIERGAKFGGREVAIEEEERM
jgi:hypothetical protein